MGYNPENMKNSSRVYVDPDGEKRSGGLIVAKKVTSQEAAQEVRLMRGDADSDCDGMTG